MPEWSNGPGLGLYHGWGYLSYGKMVTGGLDEEDTWWLSAYAGSR